MKLSLTLALSLLGLKALASMNKVVYGQDDRQDVVFVKNRLHAQLARSTAAMVENRKIEKIGATCKLAFDDTLETGQNVCPTEKFSQQPVGAMCSGFLIGEDTLVTAGHCFLSLAQLGYPTEASVCRNFSWVFNYALDQHVRDPLLGKASDVYGCKSVVVARLTPTQDFAVIKLDRKVVGRAPLKFRTGGKVSDSASLVVIGHPSGLPSKVAGGARVLRNNAKSTFGASLDTFHGNSGSAVFDEASGQLEGILVQGKTDYRPNLPSNPLSCKVVNVCNSTGKGCAVRNDALDAEVVTRITEILPYLTGKPVATIRTVTL